MRNTKLEIFFRFSGKPGSAHTNGGPLDTQSPENRSVVDSQRVLRRIVRMMAAHAFPMMFTMPEGNVASADDYLREVEEQDGWRGKIETNGLSFQFNHLPRLGLSFLIVEELRSGAAQSWKTWVDAFLDEPTFLQAWISDVDYQFWQSAHDPLQYRAAGRSVEGLPMVSNGLPPPLEQLDIDTSSNPARKTLRHGFVEAIGSTMWLAQPFWQAVGVDRRGVVLDSSYLHCKILEHGIVRVEALPEVFVDASTQAIQKRLRQVLFE